MGIIYIINVFPQKVAICSLWTVCPCLFINKWISKWISYISVSLDQNLLF